jgi:hypothetical protein
MPSLKHTGTSTLIGHREFPGPRNKEAPQMPSHTRREEGWTLRSCHQLNWCTPSRLAFYSWGMSVSGAFGAPPLLGFISPLSEKVPHRAISPRNARILKPKKIIRKGIYDLPAQILRHLPSTACSRVLTPFFSIIEWNKSCRRPAVHRRGAAVRNCGEVFQMAKAKFNLLRNIK